MIDPDFHHCMELARQARRPLYAAILFAPENARGALWAMAALDIELSRIPDLVTQSLAGQMRLQWWREALTGNAAYEPGSNPVMRALNAAFAAHAMSATRLLPLINAHESLLFDVCFETRADMEQYIAARHGTLAQAAIDVCCAAMGAPPQNVPAHIVTAMGLHDLLNNVHAKAARGHCLVPLDLLHAHGLQSGDFMADTLSAPAQPILRALREEALEAARAGADEWRALPRAARLALLPFLLAQSELRRAPDATPSSYLVQLWILWRAVRR
jgi:phytoene synthase